jgi:Rap1a immunity proteins
VVLAMRPFRPAVLALAIAAHTYAGTSAPVPLTGSELKALCTIDTSTMQICAGYVAGVSDEMEVDAQGTTQVMGANAAALMAPCPGKQMAELITSTLKELDTRPQALSNPALTAVQFALHPPLGCGSPHPSSSEEHTLFVVGSRLKGFCNGSDRNYRLQCEGYIRAVADATLLLLNKAKGKVGPNCAPTWQTPDQAVGATIVYLNAHPEHENVPAPTLIDAALLPPSCPLAPVVTPGSPRWIWMER